MTVHVAPTVRAKFYVKEKTETPVWQQDGGYRGKVITLVKFAPVYSSGPNGKNGTLENHIFGEATPCGSLEMQIANQAAADGFETGRSYYLDFTPAD